MSEEQPQSNVIVNRCKTCCKPIPVIEGKGRVAEFCQVPWLDKDGQQARYPNGRLKWRSDCRTLWNTLSSLEGLIDRCEFDDSPEGRQAMSALRGRLWSMANLLNRVSLVPSPHSQRPLARRNQED